MDEFRGFPRTLGAAAVITVLLMPYFPAVAFLHPLAATSPNTSSCDYCYSSPLQPYSNGAPISVDWRSYHNYTLLASLLIAMNESYPHLVDILTIGRTWQGRGIYCIRITDEGITDLFKRQILIVSAHHAREVITQEAALYFTLYLLAHYQTDANVQDLLASKEIYVIPCLNPDGMEIALALNSFQRKNMRPIDDDGDGLVDEDMVKDLNGNGYLECYEVDANVGTGSSPEWVISDMAYEGNATHGDGSYPGFISDNPGGVDLNRNYGFHFNDTYETSSNSTNPKVEDYKGPSPFSEPETMAVKQLVESHSFMFAMSLHSGTEVLLREWSYTAEVSALGANLTLFNMFGKAFGETSGYPYGTAGGNLGYNCSGEFGDWMYGEKKIPTMTCEIYGNRQAYQQRSLSPDGAMCIWWGAWGFFNPPSSMIEQVCLRTLKLLLHVSSINCYSSITTYIGPRTLTLSDELTSLNLTWSCTGVQDIGIASYEFLPFEERSGDQVTPVSNVFSILSDEFMQGVQLSFVYSDQKLGATGVDERYIVLLNWDSLRSQWSNLEPTLRDTRSNSLTVETDLTAGTPYYFVLALPSFNSMPNILVLFLTVIGGIIVSLVAATIIRRRRRDNRAPAQGEMLVGNP